MDEPIRKVLLGAIHLVVTPLIGCDQVLERVDLSMRLADGSTWRATIDARELAAWGMADQVLSYLRSTPSVFISQHHVKLRYKIGGKSVHVAMTAAADVDDMAEQLRAGALAIEQEVARGADDDLEKHLRAMIRAAGARATRLTLTVGELQFQLHLDGAE